MNYNDMKFYTVEEVANKLRVSQSILMGLIEGRVLEAVNVGDTGIWIIEEQCILELLAKGNNRNEGNSSVDLVENHKEDKEVEVYEEQVNQFVGEEVVLDKVSNDGVDGLYIEEGQHRENVIAEFIFDAEQAKKPVTDEIVFSKLSFDDNVHICDDQEANERLLRLSNGGNLLEEKKKGKGGKGKKSLNFNKEPGKKLRKNFVIDEELIEKLKTVRNNTGESMSNIVEEALSMFFKSKVELGQAL